MTCRNLQNYGPLAQNQRIRMMGTLLNHAYAQHSGQTSPNTKVRYLTDEEKAERIRAEQAARAHANEPGTHVAGHTHTKAGEPGISSRPASNHATQVEQQASAGILQHLWRAANDFFEAMQPAPGPSPAALAPAPGNAKQALAKDPADKAATGELSPERQQRRRALALLKTQGKLNAAQARELLDAYKAAGIPVNEHTVSPYHDWHRTGAPEILIRNELKFIYKADYRVDGKRVTRLVKYKPCPPADEQASASFPLATERPVPGGRNCELNTLAASVINQALNWKVVPQAWLGSFKTTDGKLHLALVMEFLAGKEMAIGDGRNDPTFDLGLERIQLLTSLTGEEDNAVPIVVQKQVKGSTVKEAYFADFELAFHEDVNIEPQTGFPSNGFSCPTKMHRQTWDDFMALLAPENLKQLLMPLQTTHAIFALERRASALRDFCEKLMREGDVR